MTLLTVIVLFAPLGAALFGFAVLDGSVGLIALAGVCALSAVVWASYGLRVIWLL